MGNSFYSVFLGKSSVEGQFPTEYAALEHARGLIQLGRKPEAIIEYSICGPQTVLEGEELRNAL